MSNIDIRTIRRRKANADTRDLVLSFCAAFLVAGFFISFLAMALSAGGHH